MPKEIVIIGGGVAGLAAALRLTERGKQPLIIEGGSYPSHKVCGEFLWPDCVPILKKWGVEPCEISHVNFHAQGRTASFAFPAPAGSFSHLTLDPLLASMATKQGAEILTQTKVLRLFPSIQLSNGEEIEAQQIILATGRLPHAQQGHTPSYRYVGIKAHFENLPIENCLEMFLFQQAYLGICPIENGKFNVACLVTKERLDLYPSIEHFIEQLMCESPLLRSYLSVGRNLFTEWMTARIPLLGMKHTPAWPSCYFIGDAAATIPPATGRGLSLAIHGGCLAAEYAMQRDPAGFKQNWQHACQRSLFYGHLFHKTVTDPFLVRMLIPLAAKLPWTQSLVYKLITR